MSEISILDKEMEEKPNRAIVEVTKTLGLVETDTNKNPVVAYLAGMSKGSRRGQLTALRAALAAVSGRQTSEIPSAEVSAWKWHKLTAAHIAAIRAEVGDKFEAAYGNKILSAVKGVLKAAWRLELMDREKYARLVDFDPIRGETVLAGRNITPGEIALLMQSCGEDDHLATCVRDSALLAMGFSLGYRIAEASNLDLKDYDSQTGWILLHGKGRKDREVPIANGAQDALDDWIQLRGSQEGPLFLPIGKNGEIGEGRISTTSLGRMLKKRARLAKLEKPVSWHDMRRTFAGDLFDLNVDLATVQQLMGHSSPTTTSRYDRRSSAVKMAAVSLLHVPYTRMEAKK